MFKKFKESNLFKRYSKPLNITKQKTSEERTKEYIQQLASVYIAAPFGLGMPPATGKPIQGEHVENKDKFDEWIEDADIQRLQAIMLQRNPQNIRWCYTHDNACLTAGFLLSQAVIGATGLTVKCEDEEFKEFASSYFNEIDTTKIIQMCLKDSFCFTESVWWLDYDEKEMIVKPKWIDYITLHRITNPHTGDVKWVQIVSIDSKLPQTNNENWKKYEPYLDYFHSNSFISDYPKDKYIKVHIFEDQVFNVRIFSTPPVLGILDILIWKKWMQYDAKLGGQKYATPLVDAEVSLPESYDLGSTETEALMNKISSDLNTLMNFGVLAHPDNVKVTSINQQGQVFNFVQYLDYAEKQIHKSLLVPANLLEAVGTQLATSRTTKDMFIIGVNALRNKFVREFSKLLLLQCEFVGMKEIPEFELIFSEEETQQVMTQSEEFNAVMQLFDRGIMKDSNEVRGYLTKFGMDLPQFDEEELALIESQRMNIQGGNEEVGSDEGLTKEIESDIKSQLGEE